MTAARQHAVQMGPAERAEAFLCIQCGARASTEAAARAKLFAVTPVLLVPTAGLDVFFATDGRTQADVSEETGWAAHCGVAMAVTVCFRPCRCGGPDAPLAAQCTKESAPAAAPVPVGGRGRDPPDATRSPTRPLHRVDS